MKKLFVLMVWALTITWLFWFTYACETAHLNNWDVCVSITKNWNTYTLTNQISNYNWWWTPSLNCEYQLAWWQHDQVGACNWTFQSDLNWISKIKLYIRLNWNYWEIFTWYDFDHWIWSDYYNDINNYTVDNFKIVFSPSSPRENEWVDVTVKTQDGAHLVDDYNDDIVFKIYYKSPWSAYWMSTSSSTYFEINDYNNWDRDYDNWISFRSSRNWEYKFNNFIKFKKDYEYKVVVEKKNNSNVYWYKIININWYDSEVNWYTEKELLTVNRIYHVRNTLIRKLKKEYPALTTNSNWINESDILYYHMREIVNNLYDKKNKNYDEFFAEFKKRYNYTINLIH